MRKHEKYCRDIENIENYDKALADNFKGWDCHHRLETHNSDGERRVVDISHKELIALGMYYNRPANELIFLMTKEHQSLHKKGKDRSEETKRKISKAHKGKKLSEEHKRKISKAEEGKPIPEETRRKISEAKKGQKRGPLSEEWKRNLSKAHKDLMDKVRQSYKEYKLSGGDLKWNDFQKQYRGDKE